MLRHTYENQNCSMARALELVGERWTLLIVREALHGEARFDGFLANLGVARNVLADRLAGLVDHGICQRVRYRERPPRYEYRLTDMGRDLVGVVIPLLEWGDRYLAPEGPPRFVEHEGCGGHVVGRLVCERCDRQVANEEVTTRRAASPTVRD